MTIYADSSFLVSYLYPGDKHHSTARGWFRQHATDDWITTAWSQFETYNSLRQLCLAQPGPAPEVIEALRRLFKHWHERGPFVLLETDLNEAIQEGQQLSSASGNRLRMRSADTLHIALLEQLTPDLFVTRDKDQFALAQSRAFASALV